MEIVNGVEGKVRSVADRLGADPSRFVMSGATLLVDSEPVGEIPEGAEDWLTEAVVLRGLAPRHVLFLCVANSARSQLAEGIARTLAPESVKISSAGSVPTSVRPLAVEALREIGVDASTQRSKGIDEVERPVDAVITLCAEEVCPVWLERAWRLHWGLPDPAGVEGSRERRMEAFRRVRDELRGRLGVLFGI
jgi:arsenate reductase